LFKSLTVSKQYFFEGFQDLRLVDGKTESSFACFYEITTNLENLFSKPFQRFRDHTDIGTDAEQCLELKSVFKEESKNFPFIFIFKKTAKNFKNRLRM
jgi:hypothetical protein